MPNEFINEMVRGVNTLYSNRVIVVTLFLFLAFATYTDIKYMKIYNKFNLTFLLMRVVFIFIPVYSLRISIDYILGGILGFLFLLIPAMVLMFNMGGDIKFIGVLGLYLGVHTLISFLFLSCLYNILYWVILVKVLKKGDSKKIIPFAPFFLMSFITLGIIYLI